MTDFPLNFPTIKTAPDAKRGYVGRFAPSPSGPLHFGSLVAAVGSYLQAKANDGLWLVRIEDIDPPREVAGAAADILNTLECYGLHWDKEVIYQSRQSHYYREVLHWLAQNGKSYPCRCSRKQINQSYIDSGQPGIYQRTCRMLQLDQPHCAIRLKNDTPVTRFTDRLQGQVTAFGERPLKRPLDAGLNAPFADDFIIHRKDGLFAYQLAVVVDDILQGITQVVRGCDLLPTTLHQMTLYQSFAHPLISYLHLPLAVTAPGLKLSKQNHATAVDRQNPSATLIKVLQFFDMKVAVPLHGAPVAEILAWAVRHWQVKKLPKQAERIIGQ